MCGEVFRSDVSNPLPFRTRLLKNRVCRLLKKISEARRTKIDPSAFAQDRLGWRRTLLVR
jgi:hypothetical protein